MEGTLHTGLIFSAFMLCMTLGGLLTSLLLKLFYHQAGTLSSLIFFISAVSMAVPMIAYEFWSVLIAFLVLETMVGMFNSCGGILRSKYYPEEIQSSVMSIFRIPLNILVVIGTTLADRANDETSRKNVFGILVGILSFAAVLQFSLFCLCFSTFNTFFIFSDNK
jgi:MFS transporter, MFS domain-containing protein family, molybdate-anion transporter